MPWVRHFPTTRIVDIESPPSRRNGVLTPSSDCLMFRTSLQMACIRLSRSDIGCAASARSSSAKMAVPLDMALRAIFSSSRLSILAAEDRGIWSRNTKVVGSI